VTAPAGVVRLRDVTLREVTGTGGARLGVEERLAVLAGLATIPVAVAEAAAPDGHADDVEFFRRAREELDLGPTELSVAGRISPGDPPATTAAVLAAVRSAGFRRATLILDARVAPAAHPGCGPAESITAVADAVAALRAEGLRVLVDLEYAVDSFVADPVCLVDLVGSGLQAGAESVVLDDTAGRALPDQVVEVCEAVVAAIGPDVGVACGDASGCAIANSLLAVGVGARWVQTSARPGTAALATTVSDLVRADLVDLSPHPDLGGLESRVARLHELLGGARPVVAHPTRPAPPARRGAVDAPERPLAQA
jgi:2-isopropylmalate synthase